MADDAGRSEWLIEPVGAGEIKVMVELGEGAQLSPEAAAALEQFVEAVDNAEVVGHAMPGVHFAMFGQIRLNSSCADMNCSKHDCSGKFDCSKYNSQLW